MAKMILLALGYVVLLVVGAVVVTALAYHFFAWISCYPHCG